LVHELLLKEAYSTIICFDDFTVPLLAMAGKCFLGAGPPKNPTGLVPPGIELEKIGPEFRSQSVPAGNCGTLPLAVDWAE
jgi:hypothetical protein